MAGEELPLKPMGRKDIQSLEALLLLGTVARQSVIEKIRNADPKDRITWIDSLAVAAGALAREKAGMPVSRIAEELGRGEQAVRSHLTGKTEAGKLVKETYEMLVRGEEVLPLLRVEETKHEEIEKLRVELEKEREEKKKLEEEIKQLQSKISEVAKSLEEIARKLKA